MSPEKGFSWTQKSELAALLVAEDKRTDQEIADEIGVSKRHLERWKQHPDFKKRVGEHVAAFKDAIRNQGIAVLENRVKAQNARWLALQQVIAERAGDPQMQDVPGGKTGLLVRQVKFAKLYEVVKPKKSPDSLADEEEESVEEAEARGDAAVYPTKRVIEMEEFAVDTGLLAEIRNHEQLSAKELGQWTEKHDVEVRDAGIGDALERKLAGLAARISAQPLSTEPDARGEG